MTKEQIREKVPELLQVLRSIPLSPELDEVRAHLALLATMTEEFADPTVQMNIPPARLRYSPVPIIGEPLSTTIIRDRGEY